MHVLSLPPAFVLSQDQTLMLNKTLIWLYWSRMNRREHSHLRIQHFRIRHECNFSLETCTAKVSFGPHSPRRVRDPQDSAAHVSLSSLCNCQRTDIASRNVAALFAKSPRTSRAPLTRLSGFCQLSRNSETKLFIASSVAAVVVTRI